MYRGSNMVPKLRTIGGRTAEVRNLNIKEESMYDVQDIKVYRNVLVLLEPLQRLANLIPRSDSRLKIQLLNAGRSVPAQIAEGFAKRRSQKEYRRFLEMAIGSSDETITHLRIIQLAHFSQIKTETCAALIKQFTIISKQLNKYIQAVSKNIPRSDI